MVKIIVEFHSGLQGIVKRYVMTRNGHFLALRIPEHIVLTVTYSIQSQWKIKHFLFTCQAKNLLPRFQERSNFEILFEIVLCHLPNAERQNALIPFGGRAFDKITILMQIESQRQLTLRACGSPNSILHRLI